MYRAQKHHLSFWMAPLQASEGIPSGCSSSDETEQPITALPLFGTLALYGYADGRIVGVDRLSRAVTLKEDTPFGREHLFGARPELHEIPRFNVLDHGTSGSEPQDKGRKCATARFAEQHLDTFTPALIQGLASNWPAMKKWDFDFFSKECGTLEVQVTLEHGKKKQMLLADYLTELQGVSEATSTPDADRQLPYLRGWYYEHDAPWLAADLWSQGDFHDVAFKDWFERLPKRCRPDFHWLFLVGAGAITPLHVDPTATHAWLTQLYGRKRFILYDPRDLSKLLQTTENQSGGALVGAAEAAARGVKGLEIVLEPGDTLFVPAFWPHHVECIENSVSVTWNFLGQKLFPLIRAAFLAHQVGAAPRAAAIAAHNDEDHEKTSAHLTKSNAEGLHVDRKGIPASARQLWVAFSFTV